MCCSMTLLALFTGLLVFSFSYLVFKHKMATSDYIKELGFIIIKGNPLKQHGELSWSTRLGGKNEVSKHI